ncbi:hypothetical protein [Spirilliplanes yamanashiensis]|uniref:Uncharacterized protein n=1 Tax=Spirilliplanes yamanashiensis TaxID=42233 RepID=A0A8J3Y9X8_9ACTN|nr:hypothetical protein [Spirilliplanes yamanashiensis]MDP9815804.1 hypothetical protein [Spirilliplanes yamanashiensis]GIJ04059.1 hypothetical protein Sya03_34110 [Spirilliplanes yamanashiensis]
MLALLLAAGSAVLSWRAADRAGDAVARLDALAAATAAPPPAPTEAAPAPTGPPAEPPADLPAEPTDPALDPDAQPTLNAQTRYAVKYTAETLRIPSACSDTVYVDLDEPRVQVPSGTAEIRYYDPCGIRSGTLAMSEGVRGSEVESEAVTPTECADQIRTRPLSTAEHPVRRGQVYCLTTSLDAARSAATTWKMVLLVVSATAQDGTITLQASAWDIPG